MDLTISKSIYLYIIIFTSLREVDDVSWCVFCELLAFIYLPEYPQPLSHGFWFRIVVAVHTLRHWCKQSWIFYLVPPLPRNKGLFLAKLACSCSLKGSTSWVSKTPKVDFCSRNSLDWEFSNLEFPPRFLMQFPSASGWTCRKLPKILASPLKINQCQFESVYIFLYIPIYTRLFIPFNMAVCIHR